jgi:uncharacterized glyoxalase superfamily protein PhnB
MTDAYYRRKGLASAVSYQNAKVAFRRLEHVFGFEPLLVLVDADDNLAHAEMTYCESIVMIGNEWSDDHKNPKSIGVKNRQSVHVRLAEGDDIDARRAHARAPVADIQQEPESQFYSDRTYRAKDLESYIWTFSITLNKLEPEQWDKASGLTTRARPN